MKKYLIFITALLLFATCKHKEVVNNYCNAAADHPNTREAFKVNGVDSVFTKNGADKSYGDLTDTFINFRHKYVDKDCEEHFTMSFMRINKHLGDKQTIYKQYTCNTQIPGACKSIGYFATIDVDNPFETFDILEGGDPSQNWVEISSLTAERIKGSYQAVFTRDEEDLTLFPSA
jgi:hypothetical protein